MMIFLIVPYSCSSRQELSYLTIHISTKLATESRLYTLPPSPSYTGHGSKGTLEAVDTAFQTGRARVFDEDEEESHILGSAR